VRFINKSLSELSSVMQALGQKSAHVPYRNCKLTSVLADSLGRLHTRELSRSQGRGRGMRRVPRIGSPVPLKKHAGTSAPLPTPASPHQPSARRLLLALPRSSARLISSTTSGNEAKTLMFVNISPAEVDASETVSALRFGVRARTVELGQATRHVRTVCDRPLSALLRLLGAHSLRRPSRIEYPPRPTAIRLRWVSSARTAGAPRGRIRSTSFPSQYETHRLCARPLL